LTTPLAFKISAQKWALTPRGSGEKRVSLAVGQTKLEWIKPQKSALTQFGNALELKTRRKSEDE
jgi:hypothetical protein